MNKLDNELAIFSRIPPSTTTHTQMDPFPNLVMPSDSIKNYFGKVILGKILGNQEVIFLALTIPSRPCCVWSNEPEARRHPGTGRRTDRSLLRPRHLTLSPVFGDPYPRLCTAGRLPGSSCTPTNGSAIVHEELAVAPLLAPGRGWRVRGTRQPPSGVCSSFNPGARKNHGTTASGGAAEQAGMQ